MKPEAQRIAIAEACGWKRRIVDCELGGATEVWFIDPTRPDAFLSQLATDPVIDAEGRHLMLSNLPDYLNDLNAMHEAVMTLDRSTLAYSTYCSHLNQIVAIANSKSRLPGIQAMDATAAQRAEAFLRTLNLWTE